MATMIKLNTYYIIDQGGKANVWQGAGQPDIPVQSAVLIPDGEEFPWLVCANGVLTVDQAKKTQVLADRAAAQASDKAKADKLAQLKGKKGQAKSPQDISDILDLLLERL